MKRRIFPKTTPFHIYIYIYIKRKKKEKKERTERCRFGTALFPFLLPPRTCSEHGEKRCLINRCPSLLACADRTRSPYTSDDAKPRGPRLDQPRSPTSRPALSPHDALHNPLSCSPRGPAQPMQPRSLCPPIKEDERLEAPERERKGDRDQERERETEGERND